VPLNLKSLLNRNLLQPPYFAAFAMNKAHVLLVLLLASSSLGIKVKDPNPPQQKKDDEKCRWGEPCLTNSSSSSSSGSAAVTTGQSTSLPFVKKTHHVPPEGFQVDARVYTDPSDKLAHFDATKLQLPYFDCASTGITTSPLKIRHAYFRHTFSASPRFEGSEFDNHAVILVTLQERVIVELNSGESQTFPPGSVILLEDVVAGGHKCKSPDGKDVTVLLLTLPHHYSGHKDLMQKNCLIAKPSTLPVRRSILTGLGVALSLLLADWLGKVAPIWLSVGIGGGCLVVGGTLGFVKSSESLLDQIDLYRERKRLLVKVANEEGEPETGMHVTES
jgi:hypothetical protein